MKLLEHTFKHARAYFGGSNKTNFSVQPPEIYSKRFINLVNNIDDMR